MGAPVWSRDPGGPLPTREIPWFSLGRRGRGGSEEEIYLKDGDFLLFLLSRSGRRRSLWPEAHGHAAAGPRSTPLFSCQERPWAGLRPPLSGRLWERLVMFVTAICLKYHTGNKKTSAALKVFPLVGHLEASPFTPCNLCKKLASKWCFQSCREGDELSSVILVLTPSHTRTATSAWKYSYVLWLKEMDNAPRGSAGCRHVMEKSAFSSPDLPVSSTTCFCLAVCFCSC